MIVRHLHIVLVMENDISNVYPKNKNGSTYGELMKIYQCGDSYILEYITPKNTELITITKEQFLKLEKNPIS